MKKVIWFDARQNLDHAHDLIMTMNQSSGFGGVMYHASTFLPELARHSKRLTVAVVADHLDHFNQVKEMEIYSKDVVIVSSDSDVLKKAKEEGSPTGFYIYINDEASMNRAYQEGSCHPYLIVEFQDETNIPLELIIAKLQNSDVNILKVVRTVEDAKVSKEVMEVGCDGIILTTERERDIMDLSSYAERADRETLQIIKAKVTKVEHLGPGERACIDTTSLFTKEEAMIIGSTSGGGLLVCSETHYLPYMNTRPFRVNAGAVHSYVWCPHDTTEYITDLRVGSQVSVVDLQGNARTVNVGRVKIEVRPLLLIEAEYEGRKVNAIVQDDWHIRIFDGAGRPTNATAFKPGDDILAYVCEPGRHVGVKIEETITEN